MESKKVVFNFALIAITIWGVLFVRMETAKNSYAIAEKQSRLKTLVAEKQTLEASYNQKSGMESIVTRAQGMQALNAIKSKQVVMVGPKGYVYRR